MQEQSMPPIADVLTADGRVIQVRPVRAQDADSLRRLYEGAERLTRDPAQDHVALVAEESGHVIGVASYERIDAAQADCAVLVAGECHGRGVGTLLLEQLAAHARGHGITTLVGEVLPASAGILRVAAGLAPSAAVEHDDGMARVRIATNFDPLAIEALDARERVAEEHSLRPLLAPHSVAVVGAGREPGGFGPELLSNILGHGYTGRVYAVNPHVPQIEGCLTFPSMSALPEAVDLVVIAVPEPAVAQVLLDAGHCGVRTAVVVTSGFSETGHPQAQQQILRIARDHGMRLVGPNCLGVLNTDPGVRLAATFAADLPADSGGLGVATQSGAVGLAVLDHAAHHRLGISTFVSLGNKADISGNDLLSYWFGDPATRAVALYLESFGNPRKFARIARALARRKPVLAVKGGRSADGQRAGASHTAAAVAPDIAVDSLFAQAGVIRADTLGEMLDAARILVDQPLPAGNRVGLVGNAGGLNVLATDAAASAGLEVPVTTTPGGNPRDLGAGATAVALGQAVRELAAGGEVDAVVAIFGVNRSNDAGTALAEIAAASDEFPDLPIAVVQVGVGVAPAQLGKRHLPVYALPEQAMRALGHAVWYAAWRRGPLGARPELRDLDQPRARRLVEAAPTGWQPWHVAAELLACYGIPVVPAAVARGLDEAVAAAARMGYPVVLKAAEPALVHKTDVGAVRLGLTDATAVSQAYQAIAAAVKAAEPVVIVQPMRGGGIELVAGVVHDAVFGSLLMTGLGGIHTDLLGDRSFQLLPVTDLDAARMWGRLRAAPLLTGYRGKSTYDTAALEDVLLRLGRLAEDFPEIAELDLNPLLVFPHGIAAVDIKLRLSPVGNEPDATQRILRS
jgi:acyl-CoA synthetase (NDP forming)/GNAT superfamily N-acetyltransferase